mmetsp:Transcript_23/g.44  ORF Transcript_23/g.44 Transcript_23/m.44 type:complete len:612 (-) Transcript_23:117-1952(-)
MLRFGMKALLLFFTVLSQASSVDGSDDTCVERVDDDAVDIERRMGQGASILDFLRPSLLEPQVLDGIRAKLFSGELVIIRDAFQPEFAEYAYSQISREDINWQREQYYVSDNLISNHRYERGVGMEDELSQVIHKVLAEGAREVKKNHTMKIYSNYDPIQNYPGHNLIKEKIYGEVDGIDDLYSVFTNDETKKFMTKISGRSCEGRGTQMNLIRTGPGCYSAPHTDFRETRSTTFLWHLSKNWKAEFGGNFYWGSSEKVEEGYFTSEFNTLVLFIPTPRSYHIVTEISERADVHRYVLAAKFNALSPSIEDPIEDWFGNEADHIKLTARFAKYIVHDMDIETAPLGRRQALSDLKQSVNDNYLHPVDYSVAVIEGDDDADFDDLDPVHVLTKESSLLDVLDPSLTKDDELLDDIRAALLSGRLVKIEDAFEVHFATRVRDLLNNSEFHRDDSASASGIPGFVDRKHVLRDNPSAELQLALGIFDHPKSKEFMAGLTLQECSGAAVYTPTWYQPGDQTTPHTGDNGLKSVAFDWHLTSDWDPSYGGALSWLRSRTVMQSYHHASFNTLYLHLPSALTPHAVTPVSFWSRGRRLAVSGSYSAEVPSEEGHAIG